MSLLGLPQPPAWMNDAACAQIGVGLSDEWFPEKGGRNTIAKDVCSRCPVQSLCRACALSRDLAGVWGGLSEHERQVQQGRRAS